MTDFAQGSGPAFDDGFRRALRSLFAWRRDVRRFRPDPVDRALVDELVRLGCLAPSVGYSQPWRFVFVDDVTRRARIQENFESANKRALAGYDGDRARLYASLKLAGLREAPIHLAVFVDEATAVGHGLGRQTIPQSLRDSVAAAVYGFSLACRAWGLGVGWLSIVDAAAVRDVLDAPRQWSLVTYLCVGYPEEEHVDPELERYGWEQRLPQDAVVVRR